MTGKPAQDRYPSLSTRIEDHSHYLNPTDYHKLLKPYVFGGREDLGIFRDFVRSRVSSQQVLELGCGTGRGTDALLEETSPNSLTLLDLSPTMLAHSKAKYAGIEGVRFVESDTVTRLEVDPDKYDLVYSLWSFSHSVHQILIDADAQGAEDLEKAKTRVKEAIRRMVVEMMESGGSFFMIHVDSESEEQSILFQQWAKLFPMFADESNQTPSKHLFDETFQELKEEGVIEFQIDHLIGDPIEYCDRETLMDIFMNFHLESFFNEGEMTEGVVSEIEEYVEEFRNEDGTYSIRPGCFIYKVQKK